MKLAAAGDAMIPLEEMTDGQFQVHTLDVLGKELAPYGLNRYLRPIRTGSGDYTRDRHLWLDGVTIDEIVRESRERYPDASMEREAS